MKNCGNCESPVESEHDCFCSDCANGNSEGFRLPQEEYVGLYDGDYMNHIGESRRENREDGESVESCEAFVEQSVESIQEAVRGKLGL